MGTLTLLYCDIKFMNYEEVTSSNFHNLKRSHRNTLGINSWSCL